jgi:hypothetical protein
MTPLGVGSATGDGMVSTRVLYTGEARVIAVLFHAPT